jgi:hypothetical protein
VVVVFQGTFFGRWFFMFLGVERKEEGVDFETGTIEGIES